jgi:hypothetical protein
VSKVHILQKNAMHSVWFIIITKKKLRRLTGEKNKKHCRGQKTKITAALIVDITTAIKSNHRWNIRHIALVLEFCLRHHSHNIPQKYRARQKVAKIGPLIFYRWNEVLRPLFAGPATGGLLLGLEHEIRAGQFKPGLGEPQEHLGRGQHDHRCGDVRHSLPVTAVQ